MQTHAVFLFNYTFYGMTETTIMNFCLFFFLVFFFLTLEMRSGR